MIEQKIIDRLKGIIPDTVLAQIPDTCTKFNITTPLRLAHFLSQCAHESAKFTVVKENLNYSAKRMLEIFKSDFDTNHDKWLSPQEKEKVLQLIGHPDRTANFVYANQNGNGNESSGDGYKYSGRGFIQLTGRVNYASFDKLVDDDILSNPGLVATKYPLMSAAFYFNSRGLWTICDKGSDVATITTVTKRVNGGTYGLDERIAYFNKYWNLLK